MFTNFESSVSDVLHSDVDACWVRSGAFHLHLQWHVEDNTTRLCGLQILILMAVRCMFVAAWS